MTELTSVPAVYSECPAGYTWAHEKSHKYWYFCNDKLNRPVFYIDEMPEYDSFPEFYQVSKAYEPEYSADLAQFNTLEEAKHYCHMLVLTGAV